MTLTNNNRVQVDLPLWEHLKFAPAVSSSLSASCIADNTVYTEEHGRYIYYLITTGSFWKYDTWTDTPVGLTPPPIAPLTWSTMKFSGAQGFEGRVLAATANTFTAPAYNGQVLKGNLVRIVGGLGDGQERIITAVADAVEVEDGIATAVTATAVTDTTQSWAINQWAGYQLRIKSGTGVGQVRRILYNDATSLTYNDVGQCAVNYNANPMPASPVFSATAGVQSVYAIESSVITVDSDWDTNPDATSKFKVFSGFITLVSSAAATPFFVFQGYDIASDTWYIRSATSALASAAGTDGTIERTTENASVWDRGAATGGTTTTLINNKRQWDIDEHKDRYVRIYSGTGVGQISKITSNTATTLTLTATLAVAPDSTSQYMIDGFDAGTATAGGASTLTDGGKTWTTNQWANYAVRIVYGTGMGQVLPIVSNTDTVLTTYKPWVEAPDTTSQYVIQGDKDNTYLFLGGQSSVITHSLEADMASYGRSNDDGLVRIGSAQYGKFPAIPITSGTGAAGTITITTAIPHGFRTGWVISHKGDTGASAVQNNIPAAITVTGATTYTYAAAGSTAAWTLSSLSTTVLKDATKNWTVNEHANKIVYYTTLAPVLASGATTMVAMEIASNTANTLTLKTASTLPVNGVSRYIIASRPAIGALDSGIATGTHSTTTLQDTSKTWVANIYAGRRLKMVSGTGQSVEVAIASNTANTLTFGATTAPVSASTSYSILGGTPRGLGLNATWLWGVSNTSKRGKYIIVPRGGATHGFDKLNLTNDTWENISISPQFETLTTGSMYAYDGGDRLYFTKEVTLRYYYLDVNTNKVHGAGLCSYNAGTAILGNRMEVFTTADGLKYLWTNRHANQECYRYLITH